MTEMAEGVCRDCGNVTKPRAELCGLCQSVKIDKVNYIAANGNHTISRMCGDTIHFKKVERRNKMNHLTTKKKKR